MSKLQLLYQPAGRALEYGALACNLYRGCSHGCRYCYVPQVLHMSREEFHREVKPTKDALKRLEHDCQTVHPEPIFLCFTCDPYAPCEESVTHEALRIIKASGNRVRILTKGRIPDDDLDLLGPGDEVGVTLTLHWRTDLLEWEPGALSARERLVNLMRAKGRGCRTWASLEPVIYPEQTLDLIRVARSCADAIKVGTANHTSRWNWPSEEWRQWVKSIDWEAFAVRVVELCERLGVDYTLKADLLAHLPERWRERHEGRVNNHEHRP